MPLYITLMAFEGKAVEIGHLAVICESIYSTVVLAHFEGICCLFPSIDQPLTDQENPKADSEKKL